MISAEEVLEDIGIGIKQLEDNLGKKILEYSEKINDIGNIILKLIFSFLFIISIFMEFFIVLLLLSSSRQCNCQCCESCMKSLVHIFWNILSILAIYKYKYFYTKYFIKYSNVFSWRHYFINKYNK